MGILVDSVSEVLRIPADLVEPAPDMSLNINKEFVKGIAKLEAWPMINIILISGTAFNRGFEP